MRFRLLLSALALAATPILEGCKNCRGGDATDAWQAVTEAPVPVPVGLAAEGTLIHPTDVWQRLQKNLGGFFAVLPPSVGGLVSTAFGFDPLLAAEVSGKDPAFAALGVDRQTAAVSFAIAFRLSDPRHARSVLLSTEAGAIRDVAGMSVLPRGPSAREFVGAISKGGFFVLASSNKALAELGPYAARTLPTRASPKSSAEVVFPRLFVDGVLKPKVAETWASIRATVAQQGSVSARTTPEPPRPNRGDPSVFLAFADGAIRDLVDLMADVKEARLAADFDDGGLAITLALVPESADAAIKRAANHIAGHDATPLLGLPADAILGILQHRSPEDRQKSAGQMLAALSLAMGKRFAVADAEALSKAVEQWNKTTADPFLISVSLNSPAAFVMRCKTTDSEGAAKAWSGAWGLLGRAPFFKDVLGSTLGIEQIQVGRFDAPDLAYGHLVTFGRRASKPAYGSGGPLPDLLAHVAKLELVSGVQGGEYLMALGEDGKRAFTAAAVPEHTLGEDVKLATEVKQLGAELAFAAVLRPPAFAGSSLLVGWGKHDSGLALRGRAGYALVKELAANRRE